MKSLPGVALLVLLVPASAGQEVRPASEAEIHSALQGCWGRENTLEQMQYDERMKGKFHIPYQATACFENDTLVRVSWFGGDEGMEGTGSYELAGGKLRLVGPDNADVWIFGPNQLECDVIMSPGRAMKFTNCVGFGDHGGQVLPDSSYEFNDE